MSGQLSRVTWVNVAGQSDTGPNTVLSSQGQSINILFELGGLPIGTKSIQALIIEGYKLDNIPVCSGAPVASGGAPSRMGGMTPPHQGGLPTAPMLGMPGGLNIPGDFGMQFNNCKLTRGTLTCIVAFTLPH